MKEENSKGNPYLMEFIRLKGGAKKVQHKVELGYQAIVQLEKGTRFGRPDTFAKFAEAYSDFDLIHASTGKPGHDVFIAHYTPESNQTTTADKMAASVLECEMVQLRQQLAVLRAENEMLRAENKKVWRLALPKEAIAELDFLRASSHPTVYAVERNLIGYGNRGKVYQMRGAIPTSHLVPGWPFGAMK